MKILDLKIILLSLCLRDFSYLSDLSGCNIVKTEVLTKVVD